MPETLVLLHGFGGTHRAWDPVLAHLDHERYNPLVPDLRGHGTKADVRPISFDGCVDDVLAAAPDTFALCGYSMGGRIAQLIALKAPERVTRLVLVATSAGIVDPAARAARIAEDQALADAVQDMAVAEFVARWQAQPIFAGTPLAAARFWGDDLARNQPRALAAALRTIGGGAMEPFWDRLGGLTMPVRVIVGGRDEKFLRWAREEYATRVPHAEICVIDGAGHGLPREAPEELAALIAA